MLSNQSREVVADEEETDALMHEHQQERKPYYAGALFALLLLIAILWRPVARTECQSVYNLEFSDVINVANQQEEREECIPRACLVEKHFVASPDMLSNLHAMPYTLLASFPGSGNTWTRSVIEQSTKIWTGSMYSDTELYKSGFLGEHTFVYNTPFPKTLPVDPRSTAAVVVLRRPFDALLSEFSRRVNKFVFGVNEHVSRASKQQLQTRFPTYFRNGGAWWKKFMEYWTQPMFWRNQTLHANNVTSILLNKQLFPNRNNMPILILFYEDFLRDFETTTRIMLDFIKVQGLGNAMPSVDDAVLCALHGKAHTEKAKRPRSNDDYNPFADPQNNITQHLEKMCNRSAPYWFEDKWGKCLNASAWSPAVPQQQRELPQSFC